MYYYIYTRARAKRAHTRSSLPLVQKNDYSGNLFWPWAPKRESARGCYERHALASNEIFFLKGFSRKSQKNTVSKQEEKIFYPHEILVPWYRGTAVIIIIIITTMIIIKRMSEDEVLFVPRDYVFAVVLFLCSCVSSPRISIRLASA